MEFAVLCYRRFSVGSSSHMTLVLYCFSRVSAPKLSTDPISKKHSSPDISGLGSLQPTAMTSTHKCDSHLLDSN